MKRFKILALSVGLTAFSLSSLAYADYYGYGYGQDGTENCLAAAAFKGPPSEPCLPGLNALRAPFMAPVSQFNSQS
jgi:hypothetical protein